MTGNKIRGYIKTPFVFFAGFRALAAGAAFLALGAFLAAVFNARFDGVLNLHFTEKVVWYIPLVDQLINWMSLIIGFYFLAKVFGGRRTRFVDVAGTSLLALAPMSVLPILNINGHLYETSTAMAESFSGGESQVGSWSLVWLVVSSIIMLLAIVWVVALLYQAYRITTNLKGTKLVVSFIIGLIIGVVLSKYLIVTFL